MPMRRLRIDRVVPWLIGVDADALTAYLRANGHLYPLTVRQPLRIPKPSGKGGKVRVRSQSMPL